MNAQIALLPGIETEPQRRVRHPAPYSLALLPIMAVMLRGYDILLDPFAGIGRLRTIRPDAYLVEIEREWAAISGAICADARFLPFADGYFDAICTSPAYGNRMADHHNARDGSRRHTYRHALRRPLTPGNGGGLQWGPEYRALHAAAWAECRRVLRPGGRLVVNVKDHIRGGERQRVTDWHLDTLQALGLTMTARVDVDTPGQRRGANGGARLQYETVAAFDWL